MIDHVIKTILPPIIGVLELMGIFVVAWSGLRGFWDYLQNTFRHKNYPIQYNLATLHPTGAWLPLRSNFWGCLPPPSCRWLCWRAFSPWL